MCWTYSEGYWKSDKSTTLAKNWKVINKGITRALSCYQAEFSGSLPRNTGVLRLFSLVETGSRVSPELQSVCHRFFPLEPRVSPRLFCCPRTVSQLIALGFPFGCRFVVTLHLTAAVAFSSLFLHFAIK